MSDRDKQENFAQKPYGYWESGANRLMTQAEKEVYDYLRFRRHNSRDTEWDTCWVGEDRIARECGLHPKSVSRAISDLIRMGTILLLEKGYRGKDGQPGKANKYGFPERFTFDPSKRKHGKKKTKTGCASATPNQSDQVAPASQSGCARIPDQVAPAQPLQEDEQEDKQQQPAPSSCPSSGNDVERALRGRGITRRRATDLAMKLGELAKAKDIPPLGYLQFFEDKAKRESKTNANGYLITIIGEAADDPENAPAPSPPRPRPLPVSRLPNLD